MHGTQGSTASYNLECTNSDAYRHRLVLIRLTSSSFNVVSEPTCITSSSCSSPISVPAGSTITAATISQEDSSAACFFSFRYQSSNYASSYDATAVYTPPWASDSLHLVSQGYFGTYSHTDDRAIDYILPRNTPIVAAREGTVIEFADGNGDGGECCANGVCDFSLYTENTVTVLHADGTVADYVHLEQGTIAVSVGQTVSRGTKLGESGNSGCSSAPHLHFHVKGANGNTYTPPEGDTQLMGDSWAPWLSRDRHHRDGHKLGIVSVQLPIRRRAGISSASQPPLSQVLRSQPQQPPSLSTPSAPASAPRKSAPATAAP